MAAGNRSTMLWWAVPISAFLLLLALAMVLGTRPDEALVRQSSYDASLKGMRAAYLVLHELGYPIARSRRPVGGAARWVLFPEADSRKAALLSHWIEEGGTILLADDSMEFAESLGMNLKKRRIDADDNEPATGPGIKRLAGGTIRLEWPGHSGKVWARAGGKPFITIYAHGKGSIWLANRPQFLTNRLLRNADNAMLLCQIASAMLDQRAGDLEFDEFFHGMRDRPGMLELLLRPPTLWITVQGLLLLALLLWHYVPRFGSMRALPAARRRSREEFLDAMAWLLERKGDYPSAFRTARAALLRDIAQELGLPPHTPWDILAQEVERRRSLPAESLHQTLQAAVTGEGRFIEAMNQLESTRDEFFQRRPHR